MNAKILEIFQSIQGEGKFAGVRQVFVRFFECNMHCVWCDTPHSIGDSKKEYTQYSLAELSGVVAGMARHCHSVSLTGGEPLLQKDFIAEFIPFLKKMNLPVYLETNGIFHQELKEIIDGVDIVAMDFKLPSSTQCRPYWDEHERFLTVARQKDVFVKAVITSATREEDLRRTVEIIKKVHPETLLILQPNYFEMNNGVMQRCRELHEVCLERLPHVRILPQVHKFMKLK